MISLSDFEVCEDALKFKEDLFEKKKYAFCVGDIEAYLDENEEFVFKLAVIFDGHKFNTFYDIYEMFEFMHFSKHKKFYFHNLNFDFIFFLKEIMLGIDVVIIQSGNMILSVDCGKITFMNSLSILPMSLKKVVKSFLKINWVSWEEEKSNVLDLEESVLAEYCRRDCFLTFIAVKKFDDMIQSNYSIKKYLTIPSLSLKVFNKFFIDKVDSANIFNIKNRNSFFNEGYYFGGHTEKFVNGIYDFENVNYYDVNSLYPSVMENLYVNYGAFTMVAPTFKNLQKEIDSDSIFYIDCEVFVYEEDLRIFPTFDKKQESNYYKWGWNRVKISDITVKHLIKHGWFDCIKKIHGLLICKDKGKSKIFENFVAENYAKRKSDSENEVIYKLFLNGIYGKFGQKTIQSCFILNPVNQTVPNIKSMVNYQDLNFLVEGEQDIKKLSLTYSRFDIAGRITESARILMSDYRIQIKSKGGRIFYQDTDSIQGDFDLIDLGLKNIFSNTELGLLKKENEGKGVLRGHIIGQKIYKFNAGFGASKGVKNMRLMDYKNLGRALFNRNILCGDDRLVKFEVKEKCLLTDVRPNALFYNTRFTQTKTFLKKGFFGIQIVPHYITKIRERIDGERFNVKVDRLEKIYKYLFKRIQRL